MTSGFVEIVERLQEGNTSSENVTYFQPWSEAQQQFRESRVCVFSHGCSWCHRFIHRLFCPFVFSCYFSVTFVMLEDKPGIFAKENHTF